MDFMKTSSKIITIVLAAICFLCMAVVTTLAVELYFSVNETYTYDASTDTFTIGDTSTYHTELSGITDGAHNIVVNKNVGVSQNATAYDLLLFVDDGTLSIEGKTTPTPQTISNGKCYIYSAISMQGVVTGQVEAQPSAQTLAVTTSGATTLKAVVVTHYDSNVYVKDMFTLKMTRSENNYLPPVGYQNLPYANQDDFKYVYFIDGFDINEDCTLNYPAYINLLYANLTLSHDLTISHQQVGTYSIEQIGATVDNIIGKLSIITPRAFYRVAQINGILQSQTAPQFVVKNEIDFALADNSTYLTNLLNDVLAVADGKIPTYIYSDITPAKDYLDFDVAIDYSAVAYDDTTTPNTVATSGINFETGEVTKVSNTIRHEVTISATYGETTQTSTITCYVVGTSQQAQATALADVLDDYIAFSLDQTGSPAMSYLDKRVDIRDIVIDFLTENNITQDVQFDFGANALMHFEHNNTAYKKLKIKYEGNAYILYYGDETTGVSQTNATKIPLCIDDWIMQSTTQNLAISVGSSTDNLSISLLEMTHAEKIKFLNRYLPKLYFGETDEVLDILTTSLDGLKFGDQSIATTNLGFTGINYKVYKVSEAILNDLEGDLTTIADAISNVATVDFSDNFTFENGTASPNNISFLSINSDERLIYTADFVYEGGSEKVYREIVIPTGGLGGSEYTQYITGNTFGSYFDGSGTPSIENGMLIDSVAGATGSAFKFTSGSQTVNLDLAITNDPSISSFCTIVKTGTYSQINIDLASIPARNTQVYLEATFYLGSGDTRQDISVQNYSFIIPGIYRQGAGLNFESNVLYRRIIDAEDEGGNKLYASHGGYLLVDGAKSDVESFDCALSTLTGYIYTATGTNFSANDTLDLTGIELLTNTSEMIFDNCKIQDLSPFGDFGEHNLNSLSLSGCGLTDVIFGGSNATETYLYTQNNLHSINLDNNNITSFVKTISGAEKPILYRTIRTLSIKNQTNLQDLNGIENMSEIQNVYLQDNKIKSFYDLTLCRDLQNVYIANNTATEFTNKKTGDTNTYYGLWGKINIPYYVTLINKDINIYAEDDTTALVYGNNAHQITEAERDIALMLNAIYIAETHYGSILMPKALKEYGTTATTHTIVYEYFVEDNTAVGFGETVDVNDSTLCTIERTQTLDRDINAKVILQITSNGTTVYKEFEFILKVKTL